MSENVEHSPVKKAVIVGGAGLLSTAAMMANKNIRSSVKDYFDNLTDEAKEKVGEVSKEHPKTKNAAAGAMIGKKFYTTFEKMRAAKEEIQENLEETGEQLREKGEEAKGKLSEVKSALKDQAENAKEEIKDNELTNLGNSSSDKGIKKASNIKGYSDIKGVTSIKGINYIKKP